MRYTQCLFLLLITFLHCSCSSDKKEFSYKESIEVNFGKLSSIGNNDILSEYEFISLESNDSSLFGEINQIEKYDNNYYILDRRKTNSIYVFSLDGMFKRKICSSGNGPGEFISPETFKIDSCGIIYILDRSLDKILKYNVNDLSFIEEFKLPYASPLSFSFFYDSDNMIYYYPLRKGNPWNDMQLLVADEKGNVINTLYPGTAKSKILHGNPNNFYSFNNGIRFTPYFSNDIYEVTCDTLIKRYELSWDDFSMPEENLFNKYDNSGDIMKEILSNDWIRLLYVYETVDALMVKYYIQKELYLSCFNKHTGKVYNTKIKDIRDNIGIGKKFPAPLGTVCNSFIGSLSPFDIDMDDVRDQKLRKVMENVKMEDNPILVIYK